MSDTAKGVVQVDGEISMLLVLVLLNRGLSCHAILRPAVKVRDEYS